MKRKFNIAVTVLAILFPFVGAWWWALLGMSEDVGTAWAGTSIGLPFVAGACWLGLYD